MLRLRSKTKTLGGACHWLVASLVVAALAVAAPAPAQAAPVQFAQFNQTAASQPFSFTNNGGVSGSLSYSSATLVTFNFTAPTGLSTADRTATLTFTGTTITPGAPGNFGSVNQPISVGGFSFIEQGTNANLLSGTFTNALLSGRGPSGNIIDDDVSGTVTFSSAFLTFGTGRSFDFGLNTINPLLSLGAGGFLTSFIANINGQFSSNIAVVPAPTSVAMFGTGIAAASVLAVRNRKRLEKVNEA